VEAQSLGLAAAPRQEKLASNSITKPSFTFDNENAMTVSGHDDSQRQSGKTTTGNNEIIICRRASHDLTQPSTSKLAMPLPNIGPRPRAKAMGHEQLSRNRASQAPRRTRRETAEWHE
jgi:hypothetical protein